MATNTTDDGSEPVNDDSAEVEDPDEVIDRVTQRASMSRRNAIRTGLGAAALTATGTVGTAAAQDNSSSDGSHLPESNEEAAEDTKTQSAEHVTGEDARRAVGTMAYHTPINTIAAQVAFETGAAGLDVLSDMMFGWTQTDYVAQNMDAHNLAFNDIRDAAESLSQTLTVWNQTDLEGLEYMAYSVIDSATARTLNDGATKGTAKSRVKQELRDEVFVTPERNLIRLAEAICIRIHGMYWVWNENIEPYAIQQTDTDDDGEDELVPATDSYWGFGGHVVHPDYEGETPKADLRSTRSQETSSYVYQINTPQETEYELINGEKITVGMLQVNTTEKLGWDDDNGGSGPVENINMFPVGDRDRFSTAPTAPLQSANRTYPFQSFESLFFYHAGEGERSRVTDQISTDRLQGLYDDLQSLRDAMETEAEEHVEAIYSKYDPGDVVDPGDRSPAGLVRDSGSNWSDTGDSNYAEIVAAMNGMFIDGEAGEVTVETLNADGGVVDEYTGIVIPQVSKSELPTIAYSSEDWTYDSSAGENGVLTIDRSIMAPGEHVFGGVSIPEAAFSAVTEESTSTPTDDGTDTPTSTDDSADVVAWEYEFGSDEAPSSTDELSTTTAGLVEGQETSVLTYIATSDEDADMKARMPVIDPGASDTDVESWRVTNIENRWYVAFERTRAKKTTVDNADLEALWEKWIEMEKKYDEGEDPSGGGAGGGGDGPGIELLAAAGVVGALIAALLKGGNS